MQKNDLSSLKELKLSILHYYILLYHNSQVVKEIFLVVMVRESTSIFWYLSTTKTSTFFYIFSQEVKGWKSQGEDISSIRLYYVTVNKIKQGLLIRYKFLLARTLTSNILELISASFLPYSSTTFVLYVVTCPVCTYFETHKTRDFIIFFLKKKFWITEKIIF